MQPFTFSLSRYLSMRRRCVENPQNQELHFSVEATASVRELGDLLHLADPDFLSGFTELSASSPYPCPLTVLQKCFQQVTTQYAGNPGDRFPRTVASLSNSAAFLFMF